MTTNRFKPLVKFGEFFALYRSLWLICCLLDEENDNQALVQSLVLSKAHVISDLCKEYENWNDSLDELYWCIAQITLGDSSVNPFNFEWERQAYKVHITNFFLIDLNLT